MDDQLATQLASAMTGTTPASAFHTERRRHDRDVHRHREVRPDDGARDDPGRHGRRDRRRGRPAARYRHPGRVRPRHGNARRDKDLRGARFFDTATFPLVDFRSASVPAAPTTASWSTGSSRSVARTARSAWRDPDAAADGRCRGARDRDVRPDDVAPATRSAVAHRRHRRRRRRGRAAPGARRPVASGRGRRALLHRAAGRPGPNAAASTSSSAGVELAVATAGGVFSPDRVDTGTQVLLREAPRRPRRAPSSTWAAAGGRWPSASGCSRPRPRVYAVDVNERALELTRENAAEAGLDNVRAACRRRCRPT